MITCTCIVGFPMMFTADSFRRTSSPSATSVFSPWRFTLADCTLLIDFLLGTFPILTIEGITSTDAGFDVTV